MKLKKTLLDKKTKFVGSLSTIGSAFLTEKSASRGRNYGKI